MKYLFTACFLVASFIVNAQAYTGKGDEKLQIGADFQDGATGIQFSYDYGIGANISLGLVGNYAMGIDEDLNVNFDQRTALRLRLNANIGDVINLTPKLDVYPGLSFSTKNFGGHIGTRYFFTDGFGVFTEAAFPFSKYKTEDLNPAEQLYNQFNFSIGASFNL
jgi:hypothetical protein